LGRRRTILYRVEIGSSGWIADLRRSWANSLRRCTKEIRHAFGERPVLKLVYAARQLKAIREEIDRDFTMRSATPPQALRSRSPNPFIQQRPDLAPGVIRCGAGVPAA